MSLIRHYREQAGLSQERVAELVSRSQTLVSRVERGDTFPDVDFVNRFASALDLKASDRLAILEHYEDQAAA